MMVNKSCTFRPASSCTYSEPFSLIVAILTGRMYGHACRQTIRFEMITHRQVREQKIASSAGFRFRRIVFRHAYPASLFFHEKEHERLLVEQSRNTVCSPSLPLKFVSFF